MKRNINLVYGLIFGILLITSCTKSYLNQTPQSALTTASFYATASDAEAALIAAYDALQQEYYQWDFQTNGDTRADNCYAGGDNPNNFQIDNFQVTPLNTNIDRDWSDLYVGNMRANAVLDNIDKIDTTTFSSPQRKQQIIGEARFLRAMHYFRLVRDFGGVPLVLSMNDPNIYKPRNTAEEVYLQIEADLKAAEAVLPTTFGTAAETHGRATQGAAQALLAKVYAQQLKYDSCLTYCMKVTSSPVYALLPNFDDLWTGQNENSSESIFEIQYEAANGESNWGAQLITPQKLTGDEWIKFNIPTHDLINTFRAEGDSVRLHSSVIFQVTTNVPSPYRPGDNVPYIYKWRHPNGWNSPDNVILMRLADIILLQAEALNALNRTAEAIPLINQIRNRAKLPNTTVTTQADVTQAILTERRLELAFEGERWYDLLRAGANYTIQVMQSQQNGSGANLGYNITENELVFPIPQREISLNNNVTQNAGY